MSGYAFNPFTGNFDVVGLTFPDLASPPGGTALGDVASPYSVIFAGPLQGTLDPYIQSYTGGTHQFTSNIDGNGSAIGVEAQLTGQGSAIYAVVYPVGGDSANLEGITGDAYVTDNTGFSRARGLVGFSGAVNNSHALELASVFAYGGLVESGSSADIVAGFQAEGWDAAGPPIMASFLSDQLTMGGRGWAFYARGDAPSLFGGSITATDFIWSGTKAKNTLMAGPASGSDAIPTFRKLVVADFNDGTGATSSTFWRGDGTWAAAGAGTVTSIATTSPISGGTITGTGTISLLVNTDFLFTASQSVTKAVGVTSADGLVLTNSTPAANGAQQWSPRLRLTGSGFKSNSTSASQLWDYILENQTVQGTTVSTSNLVLSTQFAAGGYTAHTTFTSAGNITVATNPATIGGSTSGGSVHYGAVNGVAYLGNTSNFGASVRASDGDLKMRKDIVFAWSSDFTSFGTADLSMARDAAYTLGVRTGTNAQKLRIYNTFTTLDTAGEWFAIDWITTANVVNLQAVKGSSSGTARVMTLSYGGAQASPVAAITIPITSGDIVFGGPVYPTGYKSSDGSAGVTAGPYTAITSITVKNGLITAITGT